MGFLPTWVAKTAAGVTRQFLVAEGFAVSTNGPASTDLFVVDGTGAITTVGGVSTAGSFGFPLSVASGAATGLTAADTNRINFTPPATATTYEMVGVVNMISWGTPASFTVVIGYKDASGNARVDTAFLIRGSNGATAAAVTAVDRWYFSFPAIDIDNSATAITLSTTGTFTGTPVYNIAAALRRIR